MWEWLAGIEIEKLANAVVILIVGLVAGLGFKRGKDAPAQQRAGLEVATDFFDSQAIKSLTTEVTGQAIATTASAAATRQLVEAIEVHTRAVFDHKEEVQELRHEMSRRR
ncbi:hypothetical protein [Aurantimonas sp. HBX-1]|uniref:hypothetical protein n=1 Tax=Aurantimonas sp. HBX-1 TaxID=2906072 RepID=UPI001F196CD5|nr:hypothetical protein [Aurantimonas sp. HBX-1]UIJ73385.1 hypothetical protein LXB15_07045 [Aurantimonas sp. HBX-1]